MKFKLFLLITVLFASSCQNDVFNVRTRSNIPNTIVLGAYSTIGFIYTSHDGGETWNQSATSQSWSAFAVNSDGTRIAAAVQTGDIYSSIDGGNTWTADNVDTINSHYWAGLSMSSDGSKLVASDYYVVGPPASTGNIYTSSDGGSTWTADSTIVTTYSARYCTYTTMSSNGARFGTVNSGSFQIYVYIYDGASWINSDVDSLTPHQFSCITSSSDGKNLAVGAQTNYIYTSTDYGATWIQRTGTGTGYWVSIASSSDGSKLVAADNGGYTTGYIWTSADGGATWTQRTSAGNLCWRAVACSSDGSFIVAGVNGGHVYVSADSGATWTERIVGSGNIICNSIAISK
jgi:hypothetical protein